MFPGTRSQSLRRRQCRCVNMADTAEKLLSAKGLREKLAAWDAKSDARAPLTDAQKDGFMELTTFSANRPLPSEVGLEKGKRRATRKLWPSQLPQLWIQLSASSHIMPDVDFASSRDVT